ncbi:MAG TPA: beta-N-acetylhexosaminidase [Roseiarcus sp.]|jgi:beta-N-acetylhexosaminidase|nr:beta-N-acetylhexosaminidase [Roseiarcus sp.]
MPKAFICGCEGLALNADERAFLRRHDPWGLILFKRNVADRDQLRELTRSFRDCVGRADAPVLIDQEGGRVQRMAPPHWRAYPAAAAIEAGLEPAKAEAAARLVARLIAADLAEVGITIDCAPVLDVADQGTHAAIGSRAFSSRPGRVAAMGRAVAEGLLAGGVKPVIKHMPGHGRARVDSHHELPVVDAARSELERDFKPFAALNDLPMAMSAHLLFTAIDSRRPATMSPIVVQEVMRGEIGFAGLIMSDDLSMKALKGPFDERAAAVIEAGLDIVLHCNGDLEEARAVASAAPPLSGASLNRASAALAATRPPEPFDVARAERELKAIGAELGVA